MTGWPAAPVVYEIDTWPWLRDLSRLGTASTLGDVPPDVWDTAVPGGTDAVWLMGVWERSPAGLAIARQDESLSRSFREAVPDLDDDADVVGSPYCVRRYVVDERLGGPEGLARARDQLARRGRRLVLDYVPNHVAPDHPSVTTHPQWFVRGTPQDLAEAPEAWIEVGGQVLAHGRDPYFPPWPDVVQMNAFAPQMREATENVLSAIGDQCDSVRCDMAMLMTNDVFAKTWGDRAGSPPADEFWPDIIGQVRARHPGMVFVAEAYWDMEWTLQQQGFDFCYDKRLYDRLAHEDAQSVRLHLSAGLDYQRKLVRFIENHDEPRAAATFPPGRDRAAAVTIATVPGATLWHDGQLEGRRTHLPVFLSRRPDEPADGDLRDFYLRLLAGVADSGLRRGTWTLLDCAGWPDNSTHLDLVSWAWHDDDPHHLVVVNFSSHRSQGRVAFPWPGARGRTWRLTDVVDGRTYDRDGDDLVENGFFVDLPPWGCHVLGARTT